MDKIKKELNSFLPNGLIDLDKIWEITRPLNIDNIKIGVENICSNNPVTTVRLPDLDVTFEYDSASGWTVYTVYGKENEIAADTVKVIKSFKTIIRQSK